MAYPETYTSITKPLPDTKRGALAGQSPANTVAAIITALQDMQTKLGLGSLVTFTADNTTDTLTSTAHGLEDGDVVQVQSSGSLPAEFAINTRYFVVNKATNTFQLSASYGGSAIDFTDDGSGTHSFILMLGVNKFLVGAASSVAAYSKDAPTGEVVGTTDAQTLTNKTITAPVLSSPDLNGTELILDANGDTSITADTDDQIDVRIGGNDLMKMTAGGFFADVLNEFSTGNGITLDGLNIKDSKLNTDDSVVTDNITDDAVTDAKRTRMSAAQISDTSTTALSTTYAKVDFDTEDFDDPGWGDLTNNRITVDEAGLYLILAEFSDDQSAAGEQIRARIYKNGSALSPERYVSGISSEISAGSLHYMGTLAANDYIELWARNDSGDANNIDRPVLTVIKLSK